MRSSANQPSDVTVVLTSQTGFQDRSPLVRLPPPLAARSRIAPEAATVKRADVR